MCWHLAVLTQPFPSLLMAAMFHDKLVSVQIFFIIETLLSYMRGSL
jgi:hypothetical protein